MNPEIRGKERERMSLTPYIQERKRGRGEPHTREFQGKEGGREPSSTPIERGRKWFFTA